MPWVLERLPAPDSCRRLRPLNPPPLLPSPLPSPAATEEIVHAGSKMCRTALCAIGTEPLSARRRLPSNLQGLVGGQRAWTWAHPPAADETGRRGTAVHCQAAGPTALRALLRRFRGQHCALSRDVSGGCTQCTAGREGALVNLTGSCISVLFTAGITEPGRRAWAAATASAPPPLSFAACRAVRHC